MCLIKWFLFTAVDFLSLPTSNNTLNGGADFLTVAKSDSLKVAWVTPATQIYNPPTWVMECARCFSGHYTMRLASEKLDLKLGSCPHHFGPLIRFSSPPTLHLKLGFTPDVFLHISNLDSLPPDLKPGFCTSPPPPTLDINLVFTL